MNFEAIKNKLTAQTEIYVPSASPSAVSEHLKKLIDENGLDFFRDTAKLTDEIQKLSMPESLKLQLCLIFRCSTLSHFILNSESDLSMVDFDNAVHNIIDSTGLTYKTAVTLTSDIFYACGLNLAAEYSPQLADNGIEYRLHALLPSEMAAEEVKKAAELYDTFQEKYSADIRKETEKSDLDGNVDSGELTVSAEERKNDANETIRSIQKLCEAGIPDGFYLLARCYMYGGCNTAIDREKALVYMKIAAERGHTQAAAYLGDLYHSDIPQKDFTAAYYYYTRPGSAAMGSPQQSALRDIYKQGHANKITLIFSGAMLVLTVLFVVFFHNGMFSGSSRLAFGVVTAVLSLALAGLTAMYHLKKKFNGIRRLIGIQFFLWEIYVFILLLA